MQQLPALGLDGGVDLLFAGLVVGLLLGQQLLCQHDVLQSGVLREQVEGLEHQPEVQPLAAHFRLPLGGGVGGVKQGLAVDHDLSPVGVSRKFRQRSRVVLPLPDDPMMARA